MPPHQQRVVDEKTELDEKVTKLTAFTEGDIFASLDADEKDRLTRQLGVMEDYSAILGARIDSFPPSGEPAPVTEAMPSDPGADPTKS